MQIDTIIVVLAANFRLLGRIHPELIADEQDWQVHAVLQDLGMMADLGHAAVIRRLDQATAACSVALTRALAANQWSQRHTSILPQYADTLPKHRIAVLGAILKAIAVARPIIPLHANATFARTNLQIGKLVYHITTALHHANL